MSRLLSKSNVYFTERVKKLILIYHLQSALDAHRKTWEKARKTDSRVMNTDALDQVLAQINCFRHLIYLLFFCSCPTCSIKQNSICFPYTSNTCNHKKPKRFHGLRKLLKSVPRYLALSLIQIAFFLFNCKVS